MFNENMREKREASKIGFKIFNLFQHDSKTIFQSNFFFLNIGPH